MNQLLHLAIHKNVILDVMKHVLFINVNNILIGQFNTMNICMINMIIVIAKKVLGWDMNGEIITVQLVLQ